MERFIMLRLVLLTLLCLTTTAAQAGDWPSWRGPKNSGISDETGLPVEFSREKNLAWRLPLPGAAGATPCVSGDRIFLTSVNDDELSLMCYSTEGKELWRRTLATGNKDVRGDEGNSAAPSPSTDGKHVWAMFADGTVGCFTVDGQQVWKLNVEDRYGRLSIAFGMTSTPVLDDGRLYLQLIHGEGNPETREAQVVALDAATGKELWAVGRPSDARDECEHSYASPMLYDYGGKKLLLSHGADFVVAHQVDSGQEAWRCGGLNLKDRYDRTLRFVASPACADGLIVVPSAKGGPCLALKPDGQGDITGSAAQRVWTHARTPDVPSPLILGDLVYLCMQDGNLYCLNRATGEEYYFERTHRQRHRASPVYADGHIYLTARDGVISVVKAGPKFELVAQNELGEAIAASPVISNGTMYLRTFDSLWAVRQK